MKKIKSILIVILSFITLIANAKGEKESKAPSFSYPSIDVTKYYGPADYKGKYLLIDFWASWCPPCNAATPKLKRLYSEYSKKGFEILGVSIDGDKQAWKKKIIENNIVWKNVLTPDKGKEISKLYHFNSIPHFVLLDREGNIVKQGFSIQQLPGILEVTIK